MSSNSFAKQSTAHLSAYDILGYLVPGAACLLFIFLFEYWARHIHDIGILNGELHTPVNSIVKLFDISLTNSSWVLGAVFLAVVMASAYVVGHLVATLSALIVDRTLVAKGHGYPHVLLLGVDSETETSFSNDFYRGFLFNINIYLLFRYLVIARLFTVPYICLVVAEWSMMVSFLVKLALSIKPGNKNIYNYCVEIRGFKRSIDWLFKVYAIPYNTTAFYLEKFLNSNRGFSTEFQNKYKTAFRSVFQMDAKSAGSNNYWLSFLYVREHDEAMTEMANNWLRLYSFARNLSTALFLAFFYQLCWVYFQKWITINSSVYQVRVLLVLPLLPLAGSLLMLIRYRYLYYDYFSKFIFRAFVYLADAKRELPRDVSKEMER
jgi:hypothetical protein